MSCYVDPAHGSAVRATLIAALEESASALEGLGLAQARYWLRCEHVLGLATDRLPEEYVATLQWRGFELFYVEHEMACAPYASPAPQVPPQNVEIVGWSADLHDAQMCAIYNAVFLDRGFAGYDEDHWVDADPSEQSEFRPDLSVFALSNGAVVGFCLCDDADEPGTGWIDTVGVLPAYRGRGAASALITRVVDAMRTAGLDRVTLRVNDDNVPARRVYERLGFVSVKRHVVYRKQIALKTEN
jgi:mycothiol synthase